MIKKLLSTGGLVSALVICAILSTLAIDRHQVLAILAVLAVEFYVWWRRPHSSLALAADIYTSWLLSIIAVIVVALSPHLVTQIIVIIGYLVMRLVIHLELLDKYPAVLGLFMQFASLAAIFSAAQVWRWSAAMVMILSWGCSWLVARNFLQVMEDKQVSLLAGVWALVVAELSWIMSWWMIAYLSPGAYIIIPQAALLITGLAYILGGIYRLHRTSQLSRNRLIEYLAVAFVLLLVILAGTHWNGSS